MIINEITNDDNTYQTVLLKMMVFLSSQSFLQSQILTNIICLIAKLLYLLSKRYGAFLDDEPKIR